VNVKFRISFYLTLDKLVFWRPPGANLVSHECFYTKGRRLFFTSRF